MQEELARGGRGLPWEDAERFLRLTLQRAIEFGEAAEGDAGSVFFDRASLAALAARAEQLPYARRVLLASPWPALFVSVAEQRHSLAAAVAEYEDLERAWPDAGHEIAPLPRVRLTERADLVEAAVRA